MTVSWQLVALGLGLGFFALCAWLAWLWVRLAQIPRGAPITESYESTWGRKRGGADTEVLPP